MQLFEIIKVDKGKTFFICDCPGLRSDQASELLTQCLAPNIFQWKK